MGKLLKDVQYALRQFRRSPGFAITAALTLSLGIGATTAIFTLIYNTMLKALPVQHASKLYMVGKEPTCCNYGGLQGDDPGCGFFRTTCISTSEITPRDFRA